MKFALAKETSNMRKVKDSLENEDKLFVWVTKNKRVK